MGGMHAHGDECVCLCLYETHVNSRIMFSNMKEDQEHHIDDEHKTQNKKTTNKHPEPFRKLKLTSSIEPVIEFDEKQEHISTWKHVNNCMLRTML